MSNTAFALSPISARATSPTEADFEAIREAFVETARGRWFLEEYTKRNRNADTALVLDAVARIERTLVAQKELRAEEPPAQPAPDLTETLTAIKAIIAAARHSAEAALSDTRMDEALAPTRKCARVIREIAWGLRESGADGRICSLLDSQVDAINAACDRMPTSGFRDDVLGAFDLATVQIDQLGASGEQSAEIRQSDTASVADEARSASSEIVEEALNVSSPVSNDNNAVAFDAAAESALPEDASSMDAATASAADTHSAPSQDTVETMETVTPAASQSDITSQADAQDDAVDPPVTAEATASEASDGITLDESLFDLSADSPVQASSDIETSVEKQDVVSATEMERSAAIAASTDVMVETAVAEETVQQTTPEPDVVTSELEQNPAQSTSSGPFADEITIVPQVVESLEAMADVAIEETACDDALSDQDQASETIEIAARDELPSDDAPQIAEMAAEEPTEPVATVEAVAAPTAAAELSVTPDMSFAASSEDAPPVAPNETASLSAKTLLPDNMLGEAIAQAVYSTASMPVAAETPPTSVADHMMSFAAGATPDAIVPPASLGASLIASGIVAKPETPRNDPLAAIRRMSHAERIAFFS
ncbi:hypothetical protein [Bradyrhizobium sp. SYSU BS000235]|uniref:hypothetical protein n=1 Tax=Bradyrhizobium sp. SYSU BS000235 TaxID=3411332 RepID=UPI003C770402